MNKPRYIVIHHAAAPDTTTLQYTAIRRFHIEDRAWVDIGYHAGVEKVGDAYVCWYGRPATYQGAHCPTMNQKSLGFCFVGDYTDTPPDDKMLVEAAHRVLAPWCKTYNLPVERIIPHKQVRPTDCPGVLDVTLLRSIVQAEMAKEF